MKTHPGQAHKPELDQLSPAQIRVVCEQLLYTMDPEQRQKFMATFPGLYVLIFPGTKDATIQKFAANESGPIPSSVGSNS